MEKKFLRAKEACLFLGIGKSTLWLWFKEGRLPRGVLLSPRCRVWSIDELETFVASKAEAMSHE